MSEGLSELLRIPLEPNSQQVAVTGRVGGCKMNMLSELRSGSESRDHTQSDEKSKVSNG